MHSSRPSTLWISCAAAILVLACCQPAQAQLWGTPVNVSLTPDAPVWGGGQQIAIDRLGVIHIVWSQFVPDAGNYHLFHSRSADGVTFSTPTDVTQFIGPNQCLLSQIGVDDSGTLHVVAGDMGYTPTGNPTRVFYLRSADGLTFSPPVYMPHADRLHSWPLLAVENNGTVHIVWSESVGTGPDPSDWLTRTWYSRSTDGVNFTAPVMASPDQNIYTSVTRLVVDQTGGITLAWVGSTEEPTQFCFYMSTSHSDDGITFSAPQRFPGLSGHPPLPSLAVDGLGAVSAIWYELYGAADTSGSILFSRAADGVTFSQPTVVADFTFNIPELAVATSPTGEVLMAWSEWAPSGRVLLRSTVDGVQLSDPIQLSSGLFEAYSPQVRVDGQGTINVVWAEWNTVTNDEALFLTRSTDGVHFSTPVNISKTSGRGAWPFSMALGPRGDVNVAWYDGPVTWPGDPGPEIYFNHELVTNTPTGGDVPVTPVDATTGQTPATIVFDSVDQPGQTTLASSGTGPELPEGFRLGEPATYYNISTTASFSGSVLVCVNYTGVSFADESALVLLHAVGGIWQDITASRNPATKTICGNTTSFSPFAVVEPSILPQGLQSPLAALVSEGQEAPLPSKAFKVGSTLPLKLTLTRSGAVLSDQAITPPRIASISRVGEAALNLATLNLDAGQSDDNGVFFRYSGGTWIYNLSTKGLAFGTYAIVVAMPDGGRFKAAFVLK
jgi:hypothetical protein